jgi:hypothetical protein
MKTVVVHSQQKWEYMVINRRGETTLTEELNVLGQQGWELTSATHHRDPKDIPTWTAFLKRPCGGQPIVAEEEAIGGISNSSSVIGNASGVLSSGSVLGSSGNVLSSGGSVIGSGSVLSSGSVISSNSALTSKGVISSASGKMSAPKEVKVSDSADYDIQPPPPPRKP